MTNLQVLEALREANKIITKARQQNVDLTPVWTKLNHAGEYLNKQAAELLAE